jgi:hypothetical protein
MRFAPVGAGLVVLSTQWGCDKKTVRGGEELKKETLGQTKSRTKNVPIYEEFEQCALAARRAVVEIKGDITKCGKVFLGLPTGEKTLFDFKTKQNEKGQEIVALKKFSGDEGLLHPFCRGKVLRNSIATDLKGVVDQVVAENLDDACAALTDFVPVFGFESQKPVYKLSREEVSRFLGAFEYVRARGTGFGPFSLYQTANGPRVLLKPTDGSKLPSLRDDLRLWARTIAGVVLSLSDDEEEGPRPIRDPVMGALFEAIQRGEGDEFPFDYWYSKLKEETDTEGPWKANAAFIPSAFGKVRISKWYQEVRACSAQTVDDASADELWDQCGQGAEYQVEDGKSVLISDSVDNTEEWRVWRTSKAGILFKARGRKPYLPGAHNERLAVLRTCRDKAFEPSLLTIDAATKTDAKCAILGLFREQTPQPLHRIKDRLEHLRHVHSAGFAYLGVHPRGFTERAMEDYSQLVPLFDEEGTVPVFWSSLTPIKDNIESALILMSASVKEKAQKILNSVGIHELPDYDQLSALLDQELIH